MLLIGYPFAGRAYVTHESSIYHLLASGLRVGLGQRGDITGNQGRGTGHGHGARVVRDELGTFDSSLSAGRGESTLYKVTRKGKGARAHYVREVLETRQGARGAALGKRARSVGVFGVDIGLDRSSSVDRWLRPMRDSNSFALDVQRLGQFGAVVFVPSHPVLDERKQGARVRILGELDQEHFAGRQIMAIANKQAFNQANKLFQLRGVRASATSIDEAAAAAVHGVLCYEHDGAWVQRRFDKVSADRWQHPSFLRAVRLWASRAAFKSFCAWASNGTTGDNTAGSFGGRAAVDEFTTALADQLSMASWRRDDPIWFESEQSTRWRIVRWVYRVGFREFSRNLSGKGAGRARQAALRRCRVVGSLAFGASLVDACAFAGFASVDNWIESCKGAGFFPALRASRKAQLQAMPAVRELRQQMRAYAMQASQAISALRSSSGFWSDASATTARTLALPSGASSVQYMPCGFKVVHPASRRSIVAKGVRGTGQAQAGFNWLRAADARERAIDQAVRLRDQALALIDSNLASFDKCMAGLHSAKYGDLRNVLGFVDKRGRVRSRKADPSMITRARGKVSRKPRLATTVRVQVGSRSLACVPSIASQSWASSGDQGFAIIKPKA